MYTVSAMNGLQTYVKTLAAARAKKAEWSARTWNGAPLVVVIVKNGREVS